jgi:hypothetical protein
METVLSRRSDRTAPRRPFGFLAAVSLCGNVARIIRALISPGPEKSTHLFSILFMFDEECDEIQSHSQEYF